MPVNASEGLLRAAAKALGDGSQTVGIAVSGGSDSLAALYLLHSVGAKVCVATVDHGLRPAAAAEAATVAQRCATLGLPHETLVWQAGPKGNGNLMEQARTARYHLLQAWAQRRGLDRVILGHTADDQAETFLMALARGTGLDGLTGMRSAFLQGGITFMRPFLNISRADLRGFLVAMHVDWVDDPTNSNPRFARTQARSAMQALRPMGITADKLLEAIENLRETQMVLRHAIAGAALQVTKCSAGAVAFDRAGFTALPGEVQRRLLVAALRWLNGDPHPARADSVARLRLAMLLGKSATLAGCRLRNGCLLREPKAAASHETPTTSLWDHRWRVTGPHAQDLCIRALGDGIRKCPDWRKTGLQRDVLLVSPAIWRGEALIAAPLAGLPNSWAAEINQSLHAFILSH